MKTINNKTFFTGTLHLRNVEKITIRFPQASMKLVILFVVLVTLFALTTAKPMIENSERLRKREEKSGVEDELETSGDEGDEEEDGSATNDEPRGREKRVSYEELEGDEKTKDSSGDEPEQESGDYIKEKNKDSSGDDSLQGNVLQWKNTLGIRGPFTITALQPPGSDISPNKHLKKQEAHVSLDSASPPGKIEITPFAPSINGMKKSRRRCLCPLPCGPGPTYEVIACDGPYTVPCGCPGGVWPALGCGGYGSPYGIGGIGTGFPLFGGGFGGGGYGGYGGCGGCGGYGGCGGWGGYGGCGGCGGCGGLGHGGCFGHPMMCCCKLPAHDLSV